MGWKTNGLIAIGACAGFAALYYGIQVLRKKKKRSTILETSQEEVPCITPETNDTIYQKNDDNSKEKECVHEGKSFEDVPELKEFYHVYETLEYGNFGIIKLGTNVQTQEMVTIKCIEKKELWGDLSFWRERKALEDLRHQHICQMYESFESSKRIYMVLEFYSCGDLFDRIQDNDCLSEKEARRILRQILSALAYIHSQGYTHRDLKPENIMLDAKDNIKLIDFGHCAKPEGGLGTALTTVCGTPHYMAPEVINKQPYFGPDADVWSVGVILYQMLCGYIPFTGNNNKRVRKALCKQITSGNFFVPTFMSHESELLLREMLQVKPEHRIKMEELLCHPWVIKGYRGPVE